MQLQASQSSQLKPKRHRAFGSLVVSFILLILSVVVWLNRQYVVDSISFWRYEPTTAIAAITERTQLTDGGKFAFYAAQPALDGNRTFNAKCDRKEQEAAILGCYVASRIYIYDVTDERLDGIKEVTAAHELLHAVYQRLSSAERAKIDSLLEAEFAKLQDDPHYSERMAFYARTEPGQRANELHSIIGTEVASISPELEAHYGNYFRHRSVVVQLHANYRSVFTELSQRAQELSAQLDALSQQIKTASATYNDNVKELNSTIQTFNTRATAGDFSSQAQFERERQALVARVGSLEAQRATINKLTEQHEALRQEYNTTVTNSNDLYKSIDSSLAPAPKV